MRAGVVRVTDAGVGEEGTRRGDKSVNHQMDAVCRGRPERDVLMRGMGRRRGRGLWGKWGLLSELKARRTSMRAA